MLCDALVVKIVKNLILWIKVKIVGPESDVLNQLHFSGTTNHLCELRALPQPKCAHAGVGRCNL